MNRRMLLLISSPAVLMALLLVCACTVSIVALNSQQNRIFRNFHNQAQSLRAAHEMEVALRQMQFHSLLGFIDRSRTRLQSIKEDHEKFDGVLARAKNPDASGQPKILSEIEKAYLNYCKQLEDTLPSENKPSAEEIINWANTHPIEQVVAPCEELLQANQNNMEMVIDDSEKSNRHIQFILVLLGVFGPVGGLLCGFTIARTVNRSIARLQVRVQDVHSHLVPEEELIDLRVNRGIDDLHDDLRAVQERVKELVQRMQNQQLEIVRSEQLAMVGQLASSIAHEIRNPLTTMRWLIEDSIKTFPNDTLRLEDLQVLLGEIQRMERTMQGMLEFARPVPPKRKICDLREIVHQAFELIRARKRQLGVICSLNLPSSPVQANVDAAQMKSVLVNLLLNSLDAVPRGGKIEISLETLDNGDIRFVLDDNGPGIAKEIEPKLFTPFATNKPTGTGLGLSVSKRLIEEHDGTLEAASRPEGGARFIITLSNSPSRRNKAHAKQTPGADH